MLLQVVFYPLLLLQAIIGVALASVIDYEVLGFGFIPYSAIAADNERLHALFLQLHAITAWVLIVLVVVHGAERLRVVYANEDAPVNVQ